MRLSQLVSVPFDTLAVATGAKSFRRNSVLGSPYLNKRGLHVNRVRIAANVAELRRRRLERLMPKDQRAAFAEQGFVCIENVLPDDLFRGVSEEVETVPFPARELKQGNTVTRFITLSPEVLRRAPYLQRAVRNDCFQSTVRFVGASNSDPLVTLHVVITDPDMGRPDPQTVFHSDTFHPTSKGWLFLRDVERADGPFSYVPGSHRMTPARLEWEFAQSLTARDHKNGHHAGGSFRATRDDLVQMGLPAPITFPVKANTLVVADTHGFHARHPSARPSLRLALYASLRGSPFSPFAGPDILDLPGLRGRKAQMLDMIRAADAKLSGKPENQPLVGEILATSPAVR